MSGQPGAFNERVVTRATATLKAWDAAEFGPIPEESTVRANVYLADGPNVLTAAQLAGSRAGFGIAEAVARQFAGPGKAAEGDR